VTLINNVIYEGKSKSKGIFFHFLLGRVVTAGLVWFSVV